MQCSLPSGCQPFSGGRGYPLGIVNMFHFVYLINNSSCFGSWRDVFFEEGSHDIRCPEAKRHLVLPGIALRDRIV